MTKSNETKGRPTKSSEMGAPRTVGRPAGGDRPETDDVDDGWPDYRGPFDPAFDYEDLSKDALSGSSGSTR